tara:strand:- start:9661 stop:9882 length:222 start_codon:yes stop_codon:yes gene_type:complete
MESLKRKRIPYYNDYNNSNDFNKKIKISRDENIIINLKNEISYLKNEINNLKNTIYKLNQFQREKDNNLWYIS